MSRKREYEIYATEPGGDFTTRTIAYSRGTHRYIYRVYATSIRQAYALAARGALASGPRDVGVRVMEWDWWHSDVGGPDDAERKGLRTVAPYMRATP